MPIIDWNPGTLLSSLERQVFAHDVVNPPAEDRRCDADLKVVNSKGRLILTKKDVDLQTAYDLKIPDPGSVGLVSYDQNDVDHAIKDIVLSCSLSLDRVCLSTLKGSLPQPEIQVKAPEIPARVERIPQGVNITLTETVVARETIHLKVGIQEELDEEVAIANLGLLRKLNRHSSSLTSIRQLNLSKGLFEFESAMASFSRLTIFKHLFSSLEFLTNWDGEDRKDVSFDDEVARVSSTERAIIKEWRGFYNRTKHADRTDRERELFQQGLEHVHQTLRPLRKATASMFLDRLRNL